MPLWQLAVVLGAQTLGWYLAARVTEQRAARRAAARLVIDQHLTAALRDLFEQREQQQP